jgi:hypothetical protein
VAGNEFATFWSGYVKAIAVITRRIAQSEAQGKAR